MVLKCHKDSHLEFNRKHCSHMVQGIRDHQDAQSTLIERLCYYHALWNELQMTTLHSITWKGRAKPGVNGSLGLRKCFHPFKSVQWLVLLTIKSIAVFLWSFIVIGLSRSIHIKMHSVLKSGQPRKALWSSRLSTAHHTLDSVLLVTCWALKALVWLTGWVETS